MFIMVLGDLKCTNVYRYDYAEPVSEPERFRKL